MNSSTRAEVNTDWDYYVPGPDFLDIEDSSLASVRSISQPVRKFYMGNRSLTIDNWRKFTNILSDRVDTHPIKVTTASHARHCPTYLYYWSKIALLTAATGDPCAKLLPPPLWAPGDFEGTPWLPIDADENGRQWFHLDDVPGLVEPFTARLQPWDSFHFNVLYKDVTHRG